MSPRSRAPSSLFFAACLLFLVSQSGLAQTPPAQQPGWQTDLGVGLIINPEFQGSEDYRALAVPYFDVRYVDQQGVKHFFNVPQGLGTYLVRERTESGNRFAVSAALGPGFQNRDTDQFAGLDTFGIGIEARLGLEYDIGRWSLQSSVAQAVASGHEGLYGNLSANYRFILGLGAFASVGPNLRLGNSRYMSALYGISAPESAATGLSSFSAEGGLESAAIQGVLSFPVGRQWRLTGVARLGRLMGDAGDSSLTQEQNQFFVVTALTRRF